MTGTAPVVRLWVIAHVHYSGSRVERHARKHIKIVLINQRIRGRITLLNRETDHVRTSIKPYIL